MEVGSDPRNEVNRRFKTDFFKAKAGRWPAFAFYSAFRMPRRAVDTLTRAITARAMAKAPAHRATVWPTDTFNVRSEPVRAWILSVAQDIPGMLTANAITVPAATIRAEGVQICPAISRRFAPSVHMRRAVFPSCMGSSTQ